MARKRSVSSTKYPFLLEGEGVSIERDFPTDDGGVAIAWATGVLMYDEVDGTGKYAREGQVVPPGDYILSLVGAIKTEPLYHIRKAAPGATWLVSWEPA